MDEILLNKKIHNKIYKTYDKIHNEIFNSIEQKRLFSTLKHIKKDIKTSSKKKIAVDFGCGSGNLTRHYLNLGYEVIACDVSKKFLKLVQTRFNFSNKLKTIQLNGKDMSNFRSNSVDFIGAYSVLHHIPDYLFLVEEMCRVLNKGGILYLDHEQNEFFWKMGGKNAKFYSKLLKKKTFYEKNKKYFSPQNYIKFLVFKYKSYNNPRFRFEGDIHVFSDDHIKFDKIKLIFSKYNLKILSEIDYLSFRNDYDLDKYNELKDKYSDMKTLVAIKE